jgi:single-strand DNA-binding protein
MQSLNKVQLIGFLPRNPEMRYTQSGTPVTSFTVVTLRPWNDVEGEDKKSPEYTNVVAWNRLAEICNQLLGTGSKVFVEGRVQTRTWDDEQGVRRYRTEVVAEDMVVLGEKTPGEAYDVFQEDPAQTLNRAQIIGNLTRDPEQRQLPSGTLLSTFSVATNRSWVSSDGSRQEGVEFHNVIAWNDKSNFVQDALKKGVKVFIEGRLQNRTWESPEQTKLTRTEIVSEAIIFSSRLPAAMKPAHGSDEGYGADVHGMPEPPISSSAPSAAPSGFVPSPDTDDDDIFATPSFIRDKVATPDASSDDTATEAVSPEDDKDAFPFS